MTKGWSTVHREILSSALTTGAVPEESGGGLTALHPLRHTFGRVERLTEVCNVGQAGDYGHWTLKKQLT